MSNYFSGDTLMQLYLTFIFHFGQLVFWFAVLAGLKQLHAAGKLRGPLVLFGKIGAAGYLVYDIALNLTLFTVVTIDLPKEWTVTSRMKRYKARSGSGILGKWRTWLSNTLCGIANVFDPGHC